MIRSSISLIDRQCKLLGTDFAAIKLEMAPRWHASSLSSFLLCKFHCAFLWFVLPSTPVDSCLVALSASTLPLSVAAYTSYSTRLASLVLLSAITITLFHHISMTRNSPFLKTCTIPAFRYISWYLHLETCFFLCLKISLWLLHLIAATEIDIQNAYKICFFASPWSLETSSIWPFSYSYYHLIIWF